MQANFYIYETSFFYLFVKLVQINYIFSDNIHMLFLYIYIYIYIINIYLIYLAYGLYVFIYDIIMLLFYL